MKIENLIAGLGQRILSAGDLESDAGQMNTPAASGKLTDGVFAQKATYTDPAYHKFYGSIDRTIVYDLGDVCAVSGFMGSFLHEEQTAVRLPAYVRIALSEDGDGWETVAEIKPERTNVESEIRKLSAEFEPRAARYVGISFNVACWVFVDQFEVYGVRDAAGAKSIVPEKKPLLTILTAMSSRTIFTVSMISCLRITVFTAIPSAGCLQRSFCCRMWHTTTETGK